MIESCTLWATNLTGQRRRPLASGAAVLAICVWLAGAGLAGCATAPTGSEGAYGSLYGQGQYDAAYRAASAVAGNRDAADQDEAAFVAGMAAMQLGRPSPAERYLRQASRSRDESLRGDAMANLGLLQYRLGRYDAAAHEFSRAAEILDGEEQAQAYFYAGVSQQRLGRWPQARTSLLLARNTTDDAGLRRRIDDTLAVTGYTVQIGAFSTSDNAQRAAEAIAERAVSMHYGSPRLVSAQNGDQALTLVHVGTFSSFQAAYDARARLGANSAIIVPLAGR